MLLKKRQKYSNEKSERKSIDIPDEIVNDILIKLENFEEECGFTNISLSLGLLSKQFSTNSTYLSKVINVHKGKSYSKYINELRVYYAVDKINNDSSFRKFTISAIAEESGFKSAETFSKFFNHKWRL